jgi:S1-C subfamily serine protease/regulation of enolase protein 1 (concanavalin A-like superfamily)
MALSLRCPKCKATLRIAKTLEPGQEVECPKCGITLRLPAGVDDRSSTSSRSEDDDRRARPTAKSGRQDDDGDDNRWRKRTGARSHRDDDDKDDRRSEKRESNSGTVVALVAGTVLFLFLAVGGIVAAVVYVGDNDKDVAADAQPANNPVPPASAPTNTDKPGETGVPSGGESSSGTGSPTGTGTNTPAPAKTSEPVRPNAPAPAKAEMTPEVEAKIQKATVYVEVSLGNQGACGSGFIVRSTDDAAYIVTNNHVIAADMNDKEKEPAGRPGIGRPPMLPIGRPPRIGPIGMPGRRPEPKREKTEISVMLYRGTPQQMTLDATVVATDPDADLAVLRISGGRNYPAAIDLATEAELVEFSPVRIFGYPNGRKELVISRAVASQLVRNAHGELTDVQLNINSAEVTHGSSGGPVVDAMGRLVGVTVGGINEKNVGWAIPTTKLAHMFRGSVNGGLLYHIRQKGMAVGVDGESWRLDRQNRVESRTALDMTIDSNAPNQVLPPNEYHAVALLSDPLKKIRSVQVLYVVKQADSVVRDGTGWGPLRNAQKADMTLSERSAQVVLKLTDGIAEDVYAVQFAYVDGEGKTKYTQPHEVRFTFPKSTTSAGPSTPTAPATPSTPAPSASAPSTPAPSTPASPSKPSAIRPDLQGTSLPGWGVAIDPMKDCEFTPEKDRLTMKIVASGHQKPVEKINLNAPRVMREVEGDFTVTVKVAGDFSPGGRSTNPKSVPWHGAGIIVWNDGDNYIRLERAASNRGGKVTPYINFEEFKAGAHGVTNNDTAKESDCWLCMERKGNTILGSVSFDGFTWKELKPMQVEWPAKLNIGLQATTTSSQLPWSVSFEDYELKAAKAKKVE